jgi:hypothetical protein
MTHIAIEKAKLEQALEALDIAQGLLADARSYHQPKMLAAYTAINQALAAPAQPAVPPVEFEAWWNSLASKWEEPGAKVAAWQAWEFAKRTPSEAQRQGAGLTYEAYFEIGQRHQVTGTKIELIHAEIEAKLKEAGHET